MVYHCNTKLSGIMGVHLVVHRTSTEAEPALLPFCHRAEGFAGGWTLELIQTHIQPRCKIGVLHHTSR